MSFSKMSSALKAVMETGTSCSDSSRFLAVTTISSRPICSSCCAAAGPAAYGMAMAAAIAAIIWRFMDWLSSSELLVSGRAIGTDRAVSGTPAPAKNRAIIYQLNNRFPEVRQDRQGLLGMDIRPKAAEAFAPHRKIRPAARTGSSPQSGPVFRLRSCAAFPPAGGAASSPGTDRCETD